MMASYLPFFAIMSLLYLGLGVAWLAACLYYWRDGAQQGWCG